MSWRAAGVSLACGLGWWLLNQLEVPILGSGALRLGLAPLLLAGLAYGPWAVLPALLLAGWVEAQAGQWLTPGLDFYVAIAVAVLTRHKVPPLVGQLLSWVLFVGPLLLLRGATYTQGGIAAVAALAGGTVAVSLAELALSLGLVRRLVEPRGAYAGRRPLRAILVHSFVVLAALPPVWIAGYQGRAYGERQSAEAAVHLIDLARAVAGRLVDLVEFHQRALGVTAAELERQGSHDQTSIGPRLADLRRLYPSFLSLLVADRHGRIVAAESGGGGGLAALRGQDSVADRAYFVETMATGRPFVSEVFIGRGFGQDPIVALAAPRFEAGTPAGIVEGSLDLTAMAQLLSQESGADRTLVLDAGLRLVAAWPALSVPPATDLSSSPLGQRLARNTLPASAEPFCPELCQIAVFDVPELGWTVLAARPVSETQGAVERYFLSSLLWGVVPVGLAILAAWRFSLQITRPLAGLARAQAELALARGPVAVAEPSLSGPAEVGKLVAGFRGVAAALGDSYADLSRTAAEREELNLQLAQLLSGLERKVQQRTAELTAAKAAAERAGEAKGVFLAHMSHEIRTPLNAVIGFADLLLTSPLAPEQRERATALQASAESLLAVVNDILDLSKIEAGRLELERAPVDLRQLIDDTLTQFAPRAAAKGLELAAFVAPAVPDRLITDGPRLRQVLLNLVGNALRFTERGAVEVEAELWSRGSGFRGVRISVRDSGIGIAEELQGRLFLPFDQLGAGRDRGGTGLGLSISRGLVEALGGEISCQSRLGEGSTFAFTVAAAGQPGGKRWAPDLKGRVILLASAGGRVARSLARWLESWGATVQTADSGSAAKGHLATADPDALVVETTLPGAEDLGSGWRARGDRPLFALLPLGVGLPQEWSAWGARRISWPLRTAILAEQLEADFGSSPMASALVLAPNALARKTLEGRLRKAGFTAVAVADLEQAIAQLSTASGGERPGWVLVELGEDPAGFERATLAETLRRAAGGPVHLAWLGGAAPDGFDATIARPPAQEELERLRLRTAISRGEHHG